MLDEIKVSAQARCDFEQVEITIKRGAYIKKMTSNAPNTLGTKTDSCVFDEKYEHQHSLYFSGAEDTN